MNGWKYDRMNGWKYDRMDGWKYEWLEVWKDGWLKVWQYGWLEEGRMDDWKYECGGKDGRLEENYWIVLSLAICFYKDKKNNKKTP